MLRLWGRTSSINVRKVLWTLQELDVPFERIDAGLAYGHNHTPAYLAKNPNALVPLLERNPLGIACAIRQPLTAQLQALEAAAAG